MRFFCTIIVSSGNHCASLRHSDIILSSQEHSRQCWVSESCRMIKVWSAALVLHPKDRQEVVLTLTLRSKLDKLTVSSSFSLRFLFCNITTHTLLTFTSQTSIKTIYWQKYLSYKCTVNITGPNILTHNNMQVQFKVTSTAHESLRYYSHPNHNHTIVWDVITAV